ncbi:MAG: amidohydrolase, partial [Bacteroidetes bacterium HGW-Bacteroidetes-21]
MKNTKELKTIVQKYAVETKKMREYFHAHPELSFKEVNTAKYVCDVLKKHQIDFHAGIGGHGILAIIKGKKKGPVVAFRADMDALPIEELNKVPYKSTQKGVMHACGHDFHTASLLAFLLMMKEAGLDFNGTIL